MENNNKGMFNVKFEKGYITAVAIALIVVSSVVAGYFIYSALQTGPSGYHEMYLLDDQNSANNYPQTLVANQNSTFNQQVFVANKRTIPQDYQLQVKIVQDTVSFPVDAPADKTIEFSLNLKDLNTSWNSEVPISINTPGTYSVVFELYAKDQGSSANYVFTNNFCVLHLSVVAGSA